MNLLLSNNNPEDLQLLDYAISNTEFIFGVDLSINLKSFELGLIQDKTIWGLDKLVESLDMRNRYVVDNLTSEDDGWDDIISIDSAITYLANVNKYSEITLVSTLGKDQTQRLYFSEVVPVPYKYIKIMRNDTNPFYKPTLTEVVDLCGTMGPCNNPYENFYDTSKWDVQTEPVNAYLTSLF